MKSDNQGAPGGSEVLTSWVILCTAQHTSTRKARRSSEARLVPQQKASS